MTKKVVGLTGGIASGKSTVARAFASFGVPVIDADAIAREVVEQGTPGLASVVERFGARVLQPDGALDRAKLGAIVFEDAGARADLNAIVHPLIAARGAEQIRALSETDAPYILYEAALLVESGAYKAFASLIVVAVEPATQLARLMARDGSTEAEAQARIASQLPLDRKIEVADFVIRNDASIAEVKSAAREVHEALVARFTREDEPS